MAMTNVIVRATQQDGGTETCRVKLDANKFPYIVVDNEKVVLTNTTFPRQITYGYGYYQTTVDLVEGRAELEQILANPGLTTDKLGFRQLFRAG